MIEQERFTITTSTDYHVKENDCIRILDKVYKVAKVEIETTLTIRNIKWYDYVFAYIYRTWKKIKDKWYELTRF
jgi:hypothetical protein